ncbi:MAG: hypothetical protein OXH15_00310, partial [Gammaproteobacteria bacterium]|nr:hypothetical protein [Gammaproteobacteria bacterium]
RAEYAEHCAAVGRDVGEIVVMGGLPLGDVGAAAANLVAFRDAGASRFVLGGRYADADEYRRKVDALTAAMEQAA